MAQMNTSIIPDQATCLKLMAQHQMPPHIVRHSMVVCALAMYIARELEKNGHPLNLEIVRAGGLLHDITKRHSLNQPLDHALTGAKLLKNLGYYPVAEVVRQHVRLSPSRPPGRIAEVEVVNYADKRVVNDQVTTLAGRFEYIQKRYAKSEQARIYINQYRAHILELEKDIFDKISGGPDQLFHLNLDQEGLAQLLQL